MQLNVLILPGDGIGVEVTRQAVRVLEKVCSTFGHNLHLTEGLLGGIAIHQTGTPFPDETAKLAVEADATLMSAAASAIATINVMPLVPGDDVTCLRMARTKLRAMLLHLSREIEKGAS
jgi:3-isopropylmalate dehydrogenase